MRRPAARPPVYPNPRAHAESRPSLSLLTMSGSRALLNIVPRATPTLAITMHARASGADAIAGAANHSGRGNDADKREAHDPRLAAPADIGDGAQRRAQQGNDQSARADGIAPDRLTPDLVADDRGREIGREDKGDDQRVERRVRPIEQRPRELTDAESWRWRTAPPEEAEAKPLLCPLLASTRWIGLPISVAIIFRDLGSPRLDLFQASVRRARYG